MLIFAHIVKREIDRMMARKWLKIAEECCWRREGSIQDELRRRYSLILRDPSVGDPKRQPRETANVQEQTVKKHQRRQLQIEQKSKNRGKLFDNHEEKC